jgi:hypothetical protein
MSEEGDIFLCIVIHIWTSMQMYTFYYKVKTLCISAYIYFRHCYTYNSTFFYFVCIIYVHVKWAPSHHGMAHPQAVGRENGSQIWKGVVYWLEGWMDG